MTKNNEEYGIFYAEAKVWPPGSCKKKFSAGLKGRFFFKIQIWKLQINCRSSRYEIINYTDLKNDHTKYYKLGLQVPVCKKKLPQIWLWPQVGEFIVKFYWIDTLNTMARSALALNAPNDCDTLDLSQGPPRGEARKLSPKAMWREIPSTLIPCKNLPWGKITQDQGTQAQAQNGQIMYDQNNNMKLYSCNIMYIHTMSACI